MEMSVKQSLCQCNNGAFELCVWGKQDGAPHPPTPHPDYLHSPPSVPHLTSGNSAAPFCLIHCLSVCFLLHFASSLSLILTHMLIHSVWQSQSTFELFIEHDWEDIKLPMAKQSIENLSRLFFNMVKIDLFRSIDWSTVCVGKSFEGYFFLLRAVLHCC